MHGGDGKGQIRQRGMGAGGHDLKAGGVRAKWAIYLLSIMERTSGSIGQNSSSIGERMRNGHQKRVARLCFRLSLPRTTRGERESSTSWVSYVSK